VTQFIRDLDIYPVKYLLTAGFQSWLDDPVALFSPSLAEFRVIIILVFSSPWWISYRLADIMLSMAISQHLGNPRLPLTCLTVIPATSTVVITSSPMFSAIFTPPHATFGFIATKVCTTDQMHGHKTFNQRKWLRSVIFTPILISFPPAINIIANVRWPRKSAVHAPYADDD
jgi:hypothetical protein